VAGVERSEPPETPADWGLTDQRFASVPVDPSHPSLRFETTEILHLERPDGRESEPVGNALRGVPAR
jgi:hypothetical protein